MTRTEMPSQPPAHPGNSGDLGFADAELRHGLANGQFRLIYQPKLNIRKGCVDSVEGLIRWDHPDEGLMLPDKFISRCEATGSIADLTLWTMECALNDRATFANAGRDISIFINLSAQLLTEERTVAALCDIARSGAAGMGVEVTERSMILDPTLAFANIRRLRESGLKIAIDDYGSGLSSLTYLKQIEADELKIDKSFITSLGTSHRDPLIVRSTIDLAHALEMAVTAEGVETPAARALLSVMGCDMLQGYLIGRPMRPEALLEYLASFDPDAQSTPNDGRVLRDHKFWKRA